MTRYSMPLVALGLALLSPLAACSSEKPATTASPTATQSAAAQTPSQQAPASSAATPAAASGESTLPAIKGSYATVVFPRTLGSYALGNTPPADKKILKSGNYTDKATSGMLQFAVNEGQLDMVALEVESLKDSKTFAQGAVVCGTPQGMDKVNCVAHMSDALVRVRSYGAKLTVDQVGALVEQFAAAQK